METKEDKKYYAIIIFKGNEKILNLIKMVFDSAYICAVEKFNQKGVFSRLKHMWVNKSVATYGLGVEIAGIMGDELLSGELFVNYADNLKDLVFQINTDDLDTYNKLIENCSKYNKIGAKAKSITVEVFQNVRDENQMSMETKL